MPVRHCPACQVDFRPDILVCADCGGPLEDRLEEMGFDARPRVSQPAPEEAREPDLPNAPPPGFSEVRSHPSTSEIEPFLEHLEAAGLPYQVIYVPKGPIPSYRLCVPEELRAKALGAIAPLLAPADAAALHAVEAGFDPTKGGYGRCPACGNELSAGAAECGECGLLLQSSETVCRACGTLVAADSERCDSCGLELHP